MNTVWYWLIKGNSCTTLLPLIHTGSRDKSLSYKDNYNIKKAAPGQPQNQGFTFLPRALPASAYASARRTPVS